MNEDDVAHPVSQHIDLLAGTDGDKDEIRIKFELARIVAVRMEDLGMSLTDMEVLTDIDLMDVAAICSGMVRIYDIWTIMKMLAATGLNIAIDVHSAGEPKGTVWVAGEEGL